MHMHKFSEDTVHTVPSLEHVYAEMRAHMHTHIYTVTTLCQLAKEMSAPGNQKMYFYASIIIFPLLMILAY